MNTKVAGAGPVEREVRRVRIKVGSMVVQDYACGQWPANRAGADIDPETVFDAEWNGKYWECRADGYGRQSWKGEVGGYGNGSIFVCRRDGVTAVDPEPNV
jgi:hypothetical protein